MEGWSPEQRGSAGTRARDDKGAQAAWEYARDFGCLQMLRRVHTTRGLQETMTDFWANHLHVNANHGDAWMHRYDYQDVLRRHALVRASRFPDRSLGQVFPGLTYAPLGVMV